MDTSDKFKLMNKLWDDSKVHEAKGKLTGFKEGWRKVTLFTMIDSGWGFSNFPVEISLSKILAEKFLEFLKRRKRKSDEGTVKIGISKMRWATDPKLKDTIFLMTGNLKNFWRTLRGRARLTAIVRPVIIGADGTADKEYIKECPIEILLSKKVSMMDLEKSQIRDYKIRIIIE